MININEEINAHLLKRQKEEFENHKMVIGKYSPSLLPTCLRRQYFEYTRKMEIPVDKLKIFHLGNMIHEQIAEILAKSENVKAHVEERSIALMHPDFDDVIISGRLDNFIVLKDGDKNVVIEVKSAKTLQAYDQPNHRWVDMVAPKEEHRMQLNCYLYSLPNSVGLVLYANKTTFETVQFEVQKDKELLLKTFERASTLHKHLIEKSFPVAEAKMNADTLWQCGYCPAREMCDKLSNQAVKDKDAAE